MRHRIMYFIAFIVAGAFALIFKGNPGIERIVETLSVISVIFGLSITLLFINSSIIGAAAGLRRTKKFGSTIARSFLWAIFATVIPVFVLFVLGKANLLGIGNINLDVNDVNGNVMTNLSDIFQFNLSLRSITIMISMVLFFVMISKLFVAYHLKPDTKVLRPAYLFYASNTELSYRIARAMCDIYMILLLFITSDFFFKVFSNNSVFYQQTAGLAVLLATTVIVMIVVVLPIIFAVFSGFKKNPIPAMWTAFINALVAMFTGSTLFALTTINVTHRFECYLPKKTTSVSTTILLVFSRIGSAIISYLTILFLTRDAGLGMTATLSIAGLCVVLSMFASIGTGFEVLLIVGVVSAVMNLDPVIFSHCSVLLPLLNIFSSFLDTYAISLGANSASGIIAVDKSQKSKATA